MRHRHRHRRNLVRQYRLRRRLILATGWLKGYCLHHPRQNLCQLRHRFDRRRRSRHFHQQRQKKEGWTMHIPRQIHRHLM